MVTASPGVASRARGARRESPSHRLLDGLRRRILDQELPPGAALREQDLAAEFGVSRARIRDAFGILEERGLIERVPNRGAVVARLELGRIDELFEVREVLEAQTVRLATERAPRGTWDDLASLFGEPMAAALARNDLDAYADAVHAFRNRCITQARNEVLSKLLDSLYDRTWILIRRLVLVPGRAQEGMRQQRRILAAMCAGDAQRAERLKRDNIRSARAWLHDYRKYLL